MTPDPTHPNGNTLNINNGGTVVMADGAHVEGSGSRNATGNTVNVNNGGTINANVVGGAAWSSGASATGNTVTIRGGTFAPYVILMGGDFGTNSGDAFTGNTLNLELSGLTVKGLANFAAYNFKLPSSITANSTVITATNGDGDSNAISIGGTTIGVSFTAAPTFSVGNKITLINGGTYGVTGTPTTTTLTASGYTFSIAVENGKLVATVTAVPGGGTTAPSLSAGTVSRISDTNAIVKFTSNEAGIYYYEVVASGAGKPNINTSTGGTPRTTSQQTITLTNLTAGAWDIYIRVKDAAGNVSVDTFKITIPAYAGPVIGNGWDLTSGVLTISTDAGMTDWKASGWYSNKLNITSVVIENAVTAIGVEAFDGCANIVSVSIGSGVLSIGDYAFIMPAKALPLLRFRINGYFARMVHAPAENGPLCREKWSSVSRGWSICKGMHKHTIRGAGRSLAAAASDRPALRTTF